MEGMKVCTNPKCGKELPATNEYFSKNKTIKDGLERWCKECRNKKQRDHRVEKAKGKGRKILPSKKSSISPGKIVYRDPVITTATPGEIVRALRRGIAQEMITIIQEEFID